MTDCNCESMGGRFGAHRSVCPAQRLMDDLSAWRENRDGKWFRDIGYALQDVLQGHRYEIRKKGSKPDDPGWHECSCGAWEGYWSDFHPHVADHLRAVVVQAAEVNPEE